MKKGQVLEGTVEKVEFPNKGIVSVPEEEKCVIVKNTMSGQKIKFCIHKFKRGNPEGRLLKVLKKSPLETREPVCSIFPECGGCMYQTMSYEEQLKMKAGQVKEILDDAVKGDWCFEGIKPSPQEFAYRNKMEFSFGDEFKDGPMALGMHRRGSFYDVVTTTECQIVDPDFCEILKASKEYFEKLGLGFYKKMQHTGYLRHLLVRRAVKTGEILVDLVTTSQEDPDLKPFAKLLLSLPLSGRIVGILHTWNDSLSDAVKNDRTDILYGQDYFYEELLGLKFKISPFSFFQTNSLGAEVLYDKARSYVGDTKDMVVFDLYSGTGTIAQMIAPVAKKVVGVEIVEEAVEAAKENARMNGLDNCEFIAGDVLKVIDDIGEKPDLIILDPPRDGIHPKALGKIIDYGVKRIVYISCKPTSLVRDLAVFQERGYQVEKVCAVDMFPGTGNVEVCCRMSLVDEEGE